MSPFPSLAAAQSPSYKFMRRKPLPSISSESTMSHLSSPWYKELISGLMEQAVSLLIYKYGFEKNLTRNLGFISFPVTETLMDLFLGFRKLKGSRISLSSEINWSCLLCNLEEAEQVHRASCQAVRSMFQLSNTSHHASHHSTICHSPESLSMLPPAATWEDQAKAAEPCLSSEWSRSPPAQGSPSTLRCPSPALAPVHLRKRCTRTRLRMSPRALPSLKWQRRSATQQMSATVTPPQEAPHKWHRVLNSLLLLPLHQIAAHLAPAPSKSQNGLNAHEMLRCASQGSQWGE